MKLAFLTAVLGVAVAGASFAPAAHAQFGRLPEITLDVPEEPGVIGDDNYEVKPEFARKVVFYRTHEQPGTIVVDTSERMLYLVMRDNLPCAMASVSAATDSAGRAS